MVDLTSFFLFHLIFEFLSFFMVMRNIVKIELINATENCLVNILSVRNFFTNWIFLYLYHFHGQDQGGVIYNIDQHFLSNIE